MLPDALKTLTTIKWVSMLIDSISSQHGLLTLWIYCKIFKCIDFDRPIWATCTWSSNSLQRDIPTLAQFLCRHCHGVSLHTSLQGLLKSLIYSVTNSLEFSPTIHYPEDFCRLPRHLTTEPILMFLLRRTIKLRRREGFFVLYGLWMHKLNTYILGKRW